MSGSLLVLLFEGHRGHIGFLAAAVLIIRLGKKGAEWIHLTFSASSVIGFIGFVRRLHPGNRDCFQCALFVHGHTLLVSIDLVSSFLTILLGSSATKEDDPTFGF